MKNLSPIFSDAFFVFSFIIAGSLTLLYFTFHFDIVPPILNRGIQPATFPKILLILIIILTALVYAISLKHPWAEQPALPPIFLGTLAIIFLFTIISKNIDFFLGLAFFSYSISFCWGERKWLHLFLVSVIFPFAVFLFFEMILGLRFPGGMITNLHYY